MKFNDNIPIYLQIMEEIQRLIINDTYHCKEKIPTVRELAVSYGVNPNTVQRALSELERKGLLISERTSGRFVTDDEELIRKLKTDVMKDKVNKFIQEIYEYGFKPEELLDELKEILENGNTSRS